MAEFTKDLGEVKNQTRMIQAPRTTTGFETAVDIANKVLGATVEVGQDRALKELANKANSIQSAIDQGIMTVEQGTAELSKVQRSFAADNPTIADEGAKLMQSALGYNPGTRNAEYQEYQSNLEKSLASRSAQQYIDIHHEFGIPMPMTADKKLDMQKLALQGQELEQHKARQDALKGAKDPTRAESVDETVYNYRKSMDVVVSNLAGNAIHQITLLRSMATNPDQQLSVDRLQTDVANAKTSVMQFIREDVARNVPLEAQAQVIDSYEQQFDSLADLFTGEFSTAEVNARILNQMETQLKMDAFQAAPIISRARALVGNDQAFSTVMSKIINTSSLSDRIGAQAEMEAFLAGQNITGSAAGQVMALSNYLSGKQTLADMSVADAQRTYQNAWQGMKALAEQPSMTGEEQQAFANMNFKLYESALQSNDPAFLRSANQVFGSAAWRRSFAQLERNPDMQETAALLADDAKRMAFKTIDATSTDVLSMASYADGVDVHFNTTTGRVEVAVDPKYYDVGAALSSADTPLGVPGGAATELEVKRRREYVQTLEQRVRSINDGYDTMAAMKKYDDGLYSLSDLQVKQSMASLHNIPVAPGQTAVSVPAGTGHEDQLFVQRAREFSDELGKVERNLKLVPRMVLETRAKLEAQRQRQQGTPNVIDFNDLPE